MNLKLQIEQYIFNNVFRVTYTVTNIIFYFKLVVGKEIKINYRRSAQIDFQID